MLTKKFEKKSTYFSSWCKWCASGDIEQAIVKILLKIWYNYIELIIFYKTVDDDFKCIMKSRNMKKKLSSK